MSNVPVTPDERQAAILALLATADRLPVAGLAERFATSEDSIRRDLRALAAAGRIRRVHGAVLPALALEPFDTRAERASAAKAAIASAVLPLLDGCRSLAIDGGTTTLALAAALPRDRRLQVLTPSIPVVTALGAHPLCEVIVVGGRYDADSRTTVGAAAVEAIRAFRADVCLIGLCSIDLAAGITATGYEEAAVKRAMIEASGEAIAVATSEKIGSVSPHVVAPAAALDHLVTDQTPDAGFAAELQAHGVSLHVSHAPEARR